MKDNGAIIVKDFSSFQEVFECKHQAKKALQEVLEYSIEYNKNRNENKIVSDIKDNKTSILYPQDFYSFKDGVPISDDQIKKWLNDIKQYMIKNNDYYRISSGDTIVIGLPYKDEYEFIVAKEYKTFIVASYNDEEKSIKEQLEELNFV